MGTRLCYHFVAYIAGCICGCSTIGGRHRKARLCQVPTTGLVAQHLQLHQFRTCACKVQVKYWTLQHPVRLIWDPILASPTAAWTGDLEIHPHRLQQSRCSLKMLHKARPGLISSGESSKSKMSAFLTRGPPLQGFSCWATHRRFEQTLSLTYYSNPPFTAYNSKCVRSNQC